MRNLNFGDAFQLARVIKKLNLKDELKEIYSGVTEESNEQEIGVDLIYTIFDKATEKQAEQEIYKFLSRPFQIDSKEVENMDLLDVIERFSKLANIEGWKSFLKQVVKLK
ncbi:hypothetical protein P5F73_00690 [Clostridium perfringens]|nr:hypothetical protein [Clostridium perfringens]